MNIIEQFRPGDFIRHSKREANSEGLKFLYVYVGTAKHTETEEAFAIYKALYGDGILYARPLKMFNESAGNGKPRFEKATIEDLKAIQDAFLENA